MTNWTQQAVAYCNRYPDVAPAPPAKADIAHLSTEVLRRHASLALSVERFDASVDYQAEIARRERISP